MEKTLRFLQWSLLLLGLLCAPLLFSIIHPSTSAAPLIEDEFAGLSDNLPGLFVELINNVIEGEIRPRKIQYQAPATLVLSDVVLFAPGERAVARVQKMTATVDLAALLTKDIVIQSLVLKKPQLLLELNDGKLNLLEAFAPKKKKSNNNTQATPPDVRVRIDAFTFENGGMRFRDQKNIAISADNASGSGHVEVKIATGETTVLVENLHISSSLLKLKELDIESKDIFVKRIRFAENNILLKEVSAKVQGAPLFMQGTIAVMGDGKLAINGQAELPENTWPLRLPPPPFPMPRALVDFAIKGNFENPQVILDVKSNSFSAYGYGIHELFAKIRVDKRKVLLNKIIIKLKNSDSDVKPWLGLLEASGDLRLKDLLFTSKIKLIKMPLKTALLPASLTPAPLGTLNGDLQIIGVVDGKHSVRITTNLHAEKVKAFELPFGELINVQAVLSAGPKQIWLRSSTLRSPDHWHMNTQGLIDLQKEHITLRLNANIANIRRFAPQLPKELQLNALHFNGKLNGPFSLVKMKGVLAMDSAIGWGNPIQNIKTQLDINKHHLILNELNAELAGSKLIGSAYFNLDKKNIPVKANFLLPQLRLKRLNTPEGKPLEAKGKGRLTVHIKNSVHDPEIQLKFDATNIEFSGEEIGSLQSKIKITTQNLKVEKLKIMGPLFTANSKNIKIKFSDLALTGKIELHKLELSRIKNATSANLHGRLAGIFDLCGTTTHPQVEAKLRIKNLKTTEIELGSGPLHVFLSPQATRLPPRCSSQTSIPKHNTAEQKSGLMVQASALLDGGIGHFGLRAAYLLNSKRVNAKLIFSQVDLRNWTQKLEPEITEFDSMTSGKLIVFGKINALQAKLKAQVENFVLHPFAKKAKSKESSFLSVAKSVAEHQAKGSIIVEAALLNGMLKADLCAFPSEKKPRIQNEKCNQNEQISLHLQGPFNQKTSAFSLETEFLIHDDNLEKIIRVLAENETQSSVEATGKIRILREGKKDSKIKTSGIITIYEQTISAKDAPTASLAEPAQLRLTSDTTLEILTPLKYQVGDNSMVINGRFGQKQMTANIDGVIAMATLTLLPNIFSQASGTAIAHLELNGPYSALRLNGSIEPKKGAQITPRSLKRRLIFKKGKLFFSSDKKDAFSQQIRSENLTIHLDEGSATLEGSVFVKISEKERNKFIVEKWDLLLIGNGLRFKNKTSRLETAFNLSLRGPYQSPLLKGRLEVTDGQASESFAMKNFVIESTPAEPSKPLVETLALASLENLQFDVDIDVRSFHAQANVASFILEADLTGAVHLADSAKLYSVTGAIEASRGSFEFPYANFELTQTRVEFPRGSNGIEPKVYLLANADLDPERTGFSSEAQCTLELAGDNKRLTLGLKALDAERNLSDTELLKFILFGFPLAAQGDADPDAALRAVSGELTAAFTHEVENAIARELGADLSFNVFAESDRVATGVKYQVGQRIDLEGETGVGLAGSSDTHIRMRLLIFDHLPQPLPFRELAFGGEIEATTGGPNANRQAGSGNLRLSLRFFEQ